MIGRIARRLGFDTRVPVALLDSWAIPEAPNEPPIVLGPLGGAAGVCIDRLGRIQPLGASWVLDWSFAAGARWVPAFESAKVRQRIVGNATVETSFETPAGEVVHRLAVAVVGGEPAAVIEIENRGRVALAMAAVIRPLTLNGRGYVASASIDTSGLLVDGHTIRFLDAPAALAGLDGAEGDMLGMIPPPDQGSAPTAVTSRSGAAQACAVWPLPHTAGRAVAVGLTDRLPSTGDVPAIDDVERGWARHLDGAWRIAVEDRELDTRLALAQRTLMTSDPTAVDAPAVIVALAESGRAGEAARMLGRLEDASSPATVAALARWWQLDEHSGANLDRLDTHLARLARAVHEVRGGLSGPSWLPSALPLLADGLSTIEQPDVAEAVLGLPLAAEAGVDETLKLPDLHELCVPRAAAGFLIDLRRRMISEGQGADGGFGSIDLLPALPVAWRGRSIDVHEAPVAGGHLSFGLRWHGPRPALLWEFTPADAGGPGQFELTVSSIDPEFASTEVTGEALLADPGWSS